MNKSESIKNLAEALNKAQAEFTPAPENADNHYFKSRYADLGSIIETVKPVLSKYGLSVSQFVEGNNGSIGLSNILMHTSGEWLESYVSMPVADTKGKAVQEAGSTISYLRRYSLAAMLGIYAGGDDDGNGVTSAPQPPQKAQTNGKANGHSNALAPSAAMSYETAINETASDGTKYGEYSDEDLQHRQIGLRKALSKKMSDEQREEYQRKLDATIVILAHRAEQGLPA